MLVSGVQHSDSIFLQTVLHCRLLQDNACNSLCYMIYPCCLSVVYIMDCISSSHVPNLPLPRPLVTTSLFSIWVCFPFAHTFICIILHCPHVSDIQYLSFSDSSLSIIFFRPIHTAANGEFLFYFFYGWVTLRCVYVPHLLIQSPPERHFVFFRVLAVVNSAAVNTGVHEPFQISVRLLDHVVVLLSVFGGTSILFSIVAAPWLSFPWLLRL